MNLVQVKCAFCRKDFFRPKGRFNEAKKFGWKQYCSWGCLSRDHTERWVLTCENCGQSFERTIHKVSPRHNYCSQSCAAIVNNKKFPKGKPRIRACVKCGKQFRRSKGYFRYCSAECKNKAKPNYDSQKLIGIIRTKTQELRRVPTRRELGNINDACRKLFGSWNSAVAAAGLQPNRSHNQRMYKCMHTKAMDGHICNSVSELLIDNWLYQNNIPHEKEACYPKTQHKADWEIISKNQKIFIEYFGLANDSSRYDRTVEKKKELCRKYKIKLIEIYHWDLYPKKQFGNKIKDGIDNLIF